MKSNNVSRGAGLIIEFGSSGIGALTDAMIAIEYVEDVSHLFLICTQPEPTFIDRRANQARGRRAKRLSASQTCNPASAVVQARKTSIKPSLMLHI
jgi:hypothetical protein